LKIFLEPDSKIWCSRWNRWSSE